MRPLLLDHMSNGRGRLLNRGELVAEERTNLWSSERKGRESDVVNVSRKEGEAVGSSPTKQLRVNWGERSGVALVAIRNS